MYDVYLGHVSILLVSHFESNVHKGIFGLQVNLTGRFFQAAITVKVIVDD